MKRKNVVIDPSEAEAVVSEFSEDQKRYFDDRFDEMKAMINDKFAYIDRSVQKTTENYLDISESVLRIETLIAEKEELIANKKDLKRGILQATFNIDNVPNVGFGSLCSEKTYHAGANWWLNIRREYSNRKGKQEQSLGARLHHNADSENISYDTNYIVRLLGSPGNIELKVKFVLGCRAASMKISIVGPLLKNLLCTHWERGSTADHPNCRPFQVPTNPSADQLSNLVKRRFFWVSKGKCSKGTSPFSDAA